MGYVSQHQISVTALTELHLFKKFICLQSYDDALHDSSYLLKSLRKFQFIWSEIFAAHRKFLVTRTAKSILKIPAI